MQETQIIMIEEKLIKMITQETAGRNRKNLPEDNWRWVLASAIDYKTQKETKKEEIKKQEE